jgi:hypothetical protein
MPGHVRGAPSKLPNPQVIPPPRIVPEPAHTSGLPGVMQITAGPSSLVEKSRLTEKRVSLSVCKGVAMEKDPNDAFDLIRQRLQVILLRAELCQNSTQCATCATAVCDIVQEIRALEALVRDSSTKGS